MPNLLHSTSVPVPQFASVSLLLNDNRHRPGGGGGGGGGVVVGDTTTAVLVASPSATISHRTALDCIDELNSHLSDLHLAGDGGGEENKPARRGKRERVREKDDVTAAVQVYRSRAGHGVGLHHLLVTDRALVDACSSVLLGAGGGDTTSTKVGVSSSVGGGNSDAARREEAPPPVEGGRNPDGNRDVVAGVVLCVAVSGSLSLSLHGPCSTVSSDSHVRLRESVPLLTRLLRQSLRTAASSASESSSAASSSGVRGRGGARSRRRGAAGAGAGDAPSSVQSSAAAVAEGQERGRKWIRVLLASLLSDDQNDDGAETSSSSSVQTRGQLRGSSPTQLATGASGTRHHHPSLSSEAGGTSYFFRKTPRGSSSTSTTTPPAANAAAGGVDPGRITTLTVVRSASTTPRYAAAPTPHRSQSSSQHRRRPRPSSTACRVESERMQVLALWEKSGDMDFGFASEAAAAARLRLRELSSSSSGLGRTGRRAAGGAGGESSELDGSFDYVPPPAAATAPQMVDPSSAVAAPPSPKVNGGGGGGTGKARTIVFPAPPSSPASPHSLRARLKRASSVGSGSAASGSAGGLSGAPRWPSSSELSGGSGSGQGGSFRRRAAEQRRAHVQPQAEPAARAGSASAAEVPAAGPWTASFDAGPSEASGFGGRDDEVVANGGDVHGEGRRRRRRGPGEGGGGRDHPHPPSSLQRALRSSSSSPEPTAMASSSSGVREGGGGGGGGRGGDRDRDRRAVMTTTVSVALNEDLTCSYRRSRLASLCIEGLVQVRASSASTSKSTPRRSGADDTSDVVVPFHLVMRDPLRHIKTIQESRAYVRDVTAEEEEERRRRRRSRNDDGDTDNGGDDAAAQRTYVVTLPKRDQYFPVVKYKCSDELCPVPLRVQTKVRFQGGTHCRVALQVSSNPVNRGTLSDLTIVLGVPSPFLRGDTLTTSPPGGVWDDERRQVSWCVAELGSGEKFQLQAQFELRTIGGEDVDRNDLEFPVSVRCHCMYAQLSRVELSVKKADGVVSSSSSSSPSDVKMKLARRYRISHRERS